MQSQFGLRRDIKKTFVLMDKEYVRVSYQLPTISVYTNPTNFSWQNRLTHLDNTQYRVIIGKTLSNLMFITLRVKRFTFFDYSELITRFIRPDSVKVTHENNGYYFHLEVIEGNLWYRISLDKSKSNDLRLICEGILLPELEFNILLSGLEMAKASDDF